LKIKFLFAYNLVTFDKVISQKIAGDSFCVSFGKRTGKKVLAGSINIDFAFAKSSAQKQRDGLARRFADIVGNAGTETDFNEPVKIFCERPVNREFLNDRVAKRPGCGLMKLFGGQFASDSINFYRYDSLNLHSQIINDALSCFFTQSIANALPEANFNSNRHKNCLSIFTLI